MLIINLNKINQKVLIFVSFLFLAKKDNVSFKLPKDPNIVMLIVRIWKTKYNVPMKKDFMSKNLNFRNTWKTALVFVTNKNKRQVCGTTNQ